MVGHFLLTLTPGQEDRVLTRVMKPWANSWIHDTGPCLLQVIRREGGPGFVSWERPFCIAGNAVGPRYDMLCCRFGTPRINNTIRNRILSNRARRALQHAPIAEMV